MTNLAQLESDVNSIKKTLYELTSKINTLSPGVRVAWEDKVTESGLTLNGSSASVEKQGVIISANLLPVSPTQVNLLFIVIMDDQTFNVVPAAACKTVQST